jgi:hypothetical protein
MEKPRGLLPDAKVAARYHVHISTLYNWDKNEKLGFPKPLRINKRKFRDEEELDQFDQARAADRDLHRLARAT